MFSLRVINRRVANLLGQQCNRSMSMNDNSGMERSADSEDTRQRTERCVNKVTLIGRVGKDGTLRGTEQQPCLILPVATNFSYKKAETGEFMSRTDWHRICVFSPGVMSYAKRITKGDRIYVEGSLSYQRIKDEEDRIKFITSIIAHEITLLSRPRGVEEERQDD